MTIVPQALNSVVSAVSGGATDCVDYDVCEVCDYLYCDAHVDEGHHFCETEAACEVREKALAVQFRHHAREATIAWSLVSLRLIPYLPREVVRLVSEFIYPGEEKFRWFGHKYARQIVDQTPWLLAPYQVRLWREREEEARERTKRAKIEQE